MAALAAVDDSAQSWRLTLRAFGGWLMVYRRTWRTTIWSSVLGPVLYLGSMGLGLGSLVDKHGSAYLGGVPYLSFLAPAILATTAMTTAMNEASYPVLGSIRWSKRYIGALASPMRPADFYRGHLLFMTMRVAINAVLFTTIMCAFGAARSAQVVLAIPAAVLTGLAFAAPIAAWAVLAQSENSFAYLLRFGIVPLTLFSGTFFPLSQLPFWLRPLAYATPLWHGVALCRALSLGRADVPGALGHVACLVAFTVAGLWAGTRTYRRRLYV
jgi:lipooligosaccharide transport system permease protein